MTELNDEDNFKIVNLQYTEQASIIVKADDDEEATAAVFETFDKIPDLKIISIEDADPELVADVKKLREEKDAEEERTLN